MEVGLASLSHPLSTTRSLPLKFVALLSVELLCQISWQEGVQDIRKRCHAHPVE